MSDLAKFQTATPATPPSGLNPAVDRVGSANAPVAGQDLPYGKIDLGAAGASSPLVRGQLVKATSIPIVLASDDDSIVKLEAIRAAAVDATAVSLVKKVSDNTRNAVRFFCSFTGTTTADTLINNFVRSDEGAATGTGLSSLNVTAGKRFRIQNINIEVQAGPSSTTQSIGTVTVRLNPAGAAVIGSQSQGIYDITTGVVANLPNGGFITQIFPDGWELGSGYGLGFSVSQLAYTNPTQVIIYKITVTGYEYTP